MKIIDQEKLYMFMEQSGHILRKPADHQTPAEQEWLMWAGKRITELEGDK